MTGPSEGETIMHGILQWHCMALSSHYNRASKDSFHYLLIAVDSCMHGAIVDIFEP